MRIKTGGMWVLQLYIDIAMESCILAVLIFADTEPGKLVIIFCQGTVANSIIFTVF